MTRALLGIDLGTSAVKALIVDEGGRVLGRGSAEYPISRPFAGAAEQNPADWWRATKDAVRQALAALGAAQIEAIGLTGQMHGTVLLDGIGEPVMPAIIWADTRADVEVREITASVGAERLIQIAGSPLATGFQAATVKWVQAKNPDRLRSVAKVLLPKDYLRFRLTGQLATDPSDASGTLLFDGTARDWSPELLSAVGLNRSMLPEIVPSFAVTGELTSDAAKDLGLPAGIPVVAGGGDAPCGALGAGVVEPTSLLLTISTGAQALVPADSPEIDRSGRMHTFCSTLDPSDSHAGWYQMGATMVAGLALRWLRDDVFGTGPDRGYDEVTSWASEVPPGADGLIFLPYVAGERTPHMNPHARGMFLGLTTHHRQGHLVRAVMEGVTLALYDAFDVLRQTGANPTKIVLAGGGAASRLWQQIVADVFELEVSPLRTAEQSALGAALLAGAGIGLFDLKTTAEQWAAYAAPIQPVHQRSEIYRRVRPIFRGAYEKHIADFDQLAAIASDARNLTHDSTSDL
jgi:xylulokinase